MSAAARSEGLVEALHSLPDLVVVIDVSTLRIVDVNEHAVARLGWCPDEVIGRPMSDFGERDGRELNPELFARVASGHTVHFDRSIRTRDGDYRNFNFAARLLDDGSSRCVLVGRDMGALADSHSRLADLLKLADLTDDVFVVCDRLGYVTYANAASGRIHGEQQFVGRHLTDFIHPDDTGYQDLVESMLSAGPRAEGRVLARRADGSPVMLGVRTIFDEQTQRWFTVERDISSIMTQEEELRRLAADLQVLASTDALTSVANRHALHECLDLAVAGREAFALLLLDMDDFKSVNDTLGHEGGDAFLICVAQRIVGSVKHDTDVVARLGGDEFVVFLPDADEARAVEVAERIADAVNQPFSIGGSTLRRSCSIGVAVAVSDDSASDVLRKADRAAYRAKYEGRSRYALHR